MAYQTCFYYNLEAAVGRDCPNHYSDVLTIELLLASFAKNLTMERWKDLAKTSGVTGFANVTGPPRPTGRYSTDLQAWIDVFLLFDNLAKDGRFDPLKDHIGSISISRGGRSASLARLCQIVMAGEPRDYFQIGDLAGLKIDVGFTGMPLARSQCK